MLHPEYRKPLQFRNVHSFVPQTPNLEEIKRANMKIKCQKAQENELTIMTPRSTRNLNEEADKKKSFRNLSLVLGCDQEETLKHHFEQQITRCNQLAQNSQNHQNKASFNSGKISQVKQNFSLGKGNLIMKKKPKQSNTIEFKEVKSTKNKRLINEKPTNQQINQRISSNQTHQLSAETNQRTEPQNNGKNLYKVNILPYANDFESSTYQSHYKASTLAFFKETLGEFSTNLSNAEIKLGNEFRQKQQILQCSIKEINDKFELISLKLGEIREQSINQVTSCMNKMKVEYKQNLKQLHEMQKSIMRYQADINQHYEDIVRELDFKCFEDIMAQYGSKLQYFEEEVKWILDEKSNQPNILIHNIRRLLKYIQKIEIKFGSKSSDREMESNFIRKPQPLLLDHQIALTKATWQRGP